MLTYRKMSLFDAPSGSILVHACNALGIWGHGIAVEFKNRFPEAHYKHVEFCTQFRYSPERILGLAQFILPSSDCPYGIGNLIVSKGFSATKSSPKEILEYTSSALRDLCLKIVYTDYSKYGQWPVYSNKFNSGLFGVPWEESEKILKTALEGTYLDWTVCSL